jgi:enamine deaminase RidA (YjgF/YER057c/UK114 family)
MPKEYVNPDNLFPSVPYGFSQIAIASGRKMVFISGQTAWDTGKNIIGGDNLLEQARQALRNLKAAMEAASGSLRDVVSLRIYIVKYEPECARYGGPNRLKPAKRGEEILLRTL